MFGFLFSWWTISSHFLPAASLAQEDLGSRLLPLLGGGGSLQLEKLERAFMEGNILQARDGDLPSAAKTFDALVRVRRGTPWTEDTVFAVNMEKSIDTWRDEKEQSGGGDGADDRGISVVAPDALDAFCEQHEGAIREFNARVERNHAYVSSEVSSAASRTRRKTIKYELMSCKALHHAGSSQKLVDLVASWPVSGGASSYGLSRLFLKLSRCEMSLLDL